MKKPNFFKKIVLSFTSESFYKTIIHEHFMKSVLFLILFSLIISAPYSIYSGLQTTHMISQIASEFPDFTYNDGSLTLKDNEPYVYKNEANSFILIVDPTEKTSINALTGYDTGYLLRSNNVIMSQAGLSPQIIPYSASFWSTMKIYLQLFVVMKPLVALFSIGFNIFLEVMNNLFRSLFAFSIILFLRSIFMVPLNFTQSYKVAIYSMTLPLFLIEILMFVPLSLTSNKLLIVFLLIDLVNCVRIMKGMNTQKMDVSL